MLDNDKIATICINRIWNSNGSLDSRMESERIRVRDAYNAETPAPARKGSSKYVSTDVFDAVESLGAQLVETFGATQRPVRFAPQGPDDVEPAREATETVAYVVERQNNGFKIKEDVIKDGLMCRMGVVKVWWEEDFEEKTETVGGANEELAAYLAKNPDAEPDEVELNDDGSFKSATFTTKTDKSRVVIESIPPEEFGITQGVRSFADADILFHRTQKTRKELRESGVDDDIVDELPAGSDWVLNRDMESRTSGADPDSGYLDPNDEREGDKIEVFECYTKLALDDSSRSRSKRKLYRVVIAGAKVIEGPDEVKRAPFLSFSPLHQSHTVWAPNYAKNVIQIQNARTMLTRSIIDHAAHTSIPRYTVLRGGVPKPDELMDGRPGGIVNIAREGAVQPLPLSGLNPFVFQTREILAEDKEAVTGVSRLSQGLNKDAISRQNSGEMVQDLVTLSQVRQKVIARRFAEFLAALYLEVYQLLIENQSGQLFVEISGSWTQVDPSTWVPREHMWIDFALGFGEKKSEAAKYVEIDKYLSADPRLAPAYDAPRRYTVLSRALEAMGVADVEAIIANPKTIQPQPPDPAQQLAAAKAQAEIAELTARAESIKLKAQLEAEALKLDHAVKMAEMEHKRAMLELEMRKLTHKEALDAAELRMTQQAQATGDAEAIISPGSR